MPTTKRSSSRTRKSGSKSRSRSTSRGGSHKSSSKTSGRARRTTTSRKRSSHSRSSHSKSGSSRSKRAGSSRKYSPKAGEHVGEEMHEMKQGKLKSGRSGKTVRNRKQAIAIGLSKARKAGAKVPSKKAA